MSGRAWFSMLAAIAVFYGAAFIALAKATPVREPQAQAAKCHTRACWKRVHVARAERWLWRQYKAHPMPYCTWAYESGTWGSPWRWSRYRAKNPSSTAGGKFQILDGTWYAYGGSYQGRVRHPAAYARPLEQERIARRVLAGQGLGAWVGC